MRRRKALPADSLELLLDTICNTFGGIVFIALLVVILLMVSDRPVAVSDLQQPTDADARRFDLLQKSQSLEEEKVRLQSALSQVAASRSVLIDPDLNSRIDRYQAVLSENQTRTASVQSLRERISSLTEEDRVTTSNSKRLADQLKDIEKKHSDLNQQLIKQQQARKTTLRTSVLKSPRGKREVMAVIQFNRLYFWHVLSTGFNDKQLNREDFLILSDQGDGVVTTPHPLKGIPLNDAEATKQMILQRIRQYSAGDVYFAVIVRPDSYTTFRDFRDVIVQAGYEYRLIPSDAETRYVDRGGRGGSVQ